MNLKNANDLVNKNLIRHLTTIDGNKSRIRGFLMWLADKNGFYTDNCRKIPVLKYVFLSKLTTTGGDSAPSKRDN